MTATASAVRVEGLAVKDYWEVKDGLCIRHHAVPRQGMFQPHGMACPVEFFRLGPICTAEMEFADGRSLMLDYEWKLGFPMSLANGEKWIGRSIFSIIDQNNNDVNNKTRKMLRGKLRQAIQVFAVERSLMTAKKKRPMTKVDVFETFAGAAKISKLATKFGLKSTTPADYETGFDLELEDDQARVDKVLKHYRPLFLIQGLRCTEWSLLQDNINYKDRPEERIHQRRELSRPMMRKVFSWCELQHAEDRFFLLENPVTSRLWLEPEVQHLLSLPGVTHVECHGGAYGQVDSEGNLIKKSFRFAGNCPGVLEKLCRKLSGEELLTCTPLEGKATSLSEEYPHKMVLEILKGIKETARGLDPERFVKRTFQAFPVQLEQDISKWNEVFKVIEEHFQRSSHRSRVLTNTDPLWKLIKPLVPWHKIERFQIASQPATLRLPMHVPHTHRGWAILYNDGEVEVNTEDLSDVRHPRGRFRKGVNYGVFLFGHADAEPDSLPPSCTFNSKADQGYHQFGDLLQADIFYARDIAGKNYLVLGVICETTHLHAAALVGSRNPNEIADAMFNIWFNPYGLPLTLRVDPDGAFRGDFEQLVGSRGVHRLYTSGGSQQNRFDWKAQCSASRSLWTCHWGTRHDWCRSDEASSVSWCVFKECLHLEQWQTSICCSTIGRIPRVGYDLFSDERALVTGETRDQAQQFANILRVEAQQHLAAMSVDSRVRRALLRKTPHETDKEAPAGSIVAYWRWTSRSGKKRGGYRLARMLAMDPDKKSYWLQSGTNTLKVAKHQLSLAHGFEQWVPDGEDIKTLRIAGDNFRDGILDDQRLPDQPPPLDDPDNPVGWDDYMLETQPTADFGATIAGRALSSHTEDRWRNSNRCSTRTTHSRSTTNYTATAEHHPFTYLPSTYRTTPDVWTTTSTTTSTTNSDS